MDEIPNTGDKRVEFDAVLTPHRSLRPRGFLVLMSLIAAVSFAAGAFFVSMGAWPVMGFFGLDAVLIYFAFRLNYRAARLVETVKLSSSLLRIERILPSGRRHVWEMNPYWARLELADVDDDRTQLSVSTHGVSVTVGAFLTEDERAEFASAFQEALYTARNRSMA